MLQTPQPTGCLVAVPPRTSAEGGGRTHARSTAQVHVESEQESGSEEGVRQHGGCGVEDRRVQSRHGGTARSTHAQLAVHMIAKTTNRERERERGELCTEEEATRSCGRGKDRRQKAVYTARGKECGCERTQVRLTAPPCSSAKEELQHTRRGIRGGETAGKSGRLAGSL